IDELRRRRCVFRLQHGTRNVGRAEQIESDAEHRRDRDDNSDEPAHEGLPVEGGGYSKVFLPLPHLWGRGRGAGVVLKSQGACENTRRGLSPGFAAPSPFGLRKTSCRTVFGPKPLPRCAGVFSVNTPARRGRDRRAGAGRISACGVSAPQASVSKFEQLRQTADHSPCVAPQWRQRHSASRGARAARASQAWASVASPRSPSSISPIRAQTRALALSVANGASRRRASVQLPARTASSDSSSRLSK